MHAFLHPFLRIWHERKNSLNYHSRHLWTCTCMLCPTWDLLDFGIWTSCRGCIFLLYHNYFPWSVSLQSFSLHALPAPLRDILPLLARSHTFYMKISKLRKGMQERLAVLKCKDFLSIFQTHVPNNTVHAWVSEVTSHWAALGFSSDENCFQASILLTWWIKSFKYLISGLED